MSAPFELIFHDTDGIPDDRGFSWDDCTWYQQIPKDYMPNLMYRSWVYREGDNDPQFALVQRDICRKDPLYWLNLFCWTYDPRIKMPRLPFITFEIQDELIYEIFRAMGYYDILIEKSRDMGASWLCLACLAHQWLFEPFQQFSTSSRVADLVDKSGDPDCLFWKIEYLIKCQPKWLRPGYTHTYLNLQNHDKGGTIKGESATGNVGRGGRNRAVFLDEFSAFGREDGYKVLASTGDNTRCRLFNGTPQGTGNAFYDVRENPATKKLRAHWSEDPRKNPGLYVADSKSGRVEFLSSTPGGRSVAEYDYSADYKFVFDGKLRSLWYDGECRRRIHKMLIAQELDIDYLSSSFQFFDSAHISILKERAYMAEHIGRLDYNPDTCEFNGWIEDADGDIHLWMPLDETGRPTLSIHFVLGADISAGTGASNSCLSGVDERTGEKRLELATSRLRPEKFAAYSVAVAQWLNNAYLIWEANGPGRQFGARVIEQKYGNIYYRQNDDSVRKKSTDIPGFSSTEDKKYQVFSEYRDALHDGWFTNFSAPALDECLEYVQEPGPKVVHQQAKNSVDPTGARHGHGDRCVADVMAWHGIRVRRGGRRKPEEDDVRNIEVENAPSNSIAARIAERQKGSKESDGWR